MKFMESYQYDNEIDLKLLQSIDNTVFKIKAMTVE